MGVGIFFVGKLADEADVLLDELPLLLHLFDAVWAVLLLQSFQELLVFPNHFHQLSFAKGFVESLLFLVTQILVETGVGGGVPWVWMSLPLESICFMRFRRAWFYLSTSILRTSARAIFFFLLLRNLNFSGFSLLTVLLRLFIFCSWIFHDLFTSLSKHSLLLTGIARNIL